MENEEKRKTHRFEAALPIRVSFLNGDSQWHAQLLNCCDKGICFRSDKPFKDKVGLLIRLDERSGDSASPEAKNLMHHMIMGEIKWCREFADEVGCHYYVTGVKYFPPAY